MKFELYNLPVWSLCYLINGDAEGLEDEEIAMIDAWMERAGVAWVCPPEEEDGGAALRPVPRFRSGGRCLALLLCHEGVNRTTGGRTVQPSPGAIPAAPQMIEY